MLGTYAVQEFEMACTMMIANTLPPVLANNQVQSTRKARAPKNPRTIRVRPWPLCTIDGTWNPHHTTPRTRVPPSAPNRRCSGSMTYPDQPSSSPAAAST